MSEGARRDSIGIKTYQTCTDDLPRFTKCNLGTPSESRRSKPVQTIFSFLRGATCKLIYNCLILTYNCKIINYNKINFLKIYLVDHAVDVRSGQLYWLTIRSRLGRQFLDPGGDFFVKFMDTSVNLHPMLLLMRPFPNLRHSSRSAFLLNMKNEKQTLVLKI